MCDFHMSDNLISPQYFFFKKAVEKIKEKDIKDVIILGDITSYGEPEGLKMVLSGLEGMNFRYVIGNSDVRNEDTRQKFIDNAKDFCIKAGNRNIYGINVYDSNISSSSCELLKKCNDGDVIVLHYSMQGLSSESRSFIENLSNDRKLEIVHGHSHKVQNYSFGKSHVRGLLALDPDKAAGNFPTITYMDIYDDEITYEEEYIKPSLSAVEDIFNYFGISCVDNMRDLKYATENGVGAVELRTNVSDWVPDLSLLPEIDKWRQSGGRYLSVHMPNVRCKNGIFTGCENWMLAVDYAKKIGADGLTMHPPRVKKSELLNNAQVWDEFLKLYVYAVKEMDGNVKIGIENLHKEPYENEKEGFCFGYVPNEVLMWINAINKELGTERVGHTLDVGHARNNGKFSQMFPVSKWYMGMGDKTVAYHIHQVVDTNSGTTNHNAIESWLGPVINYTSFLYAWEKKIINHATVFLEVKGAENYSKSIAGFNDLRARL